MNLDTNEGLSHRILITRIVLFRLAPSLQEFSGCRSRWLTLRRLRRVPGQVNVLLAALDRINTTQSESRCNKQYRYRNQQVCVEPFHSLPRSVVSAIKTKEAASG